MNTADALLICQVAPGQRRLRVSHLPEASTGLTALVSCGVASFFLLYFGLLLLFFTVCPFTMTSSASSPTQAVAVVAVPIQGHCLAGHPTAVCTWPGTP